MMIIIIIIFIMMMVMVVVIQRQLLATNQGGRGIFGDPANIQIDTDTHHISFLLLFSSF